MKDGKKLSGAVAAAIGALLYGGSQLMDHEVRIQALEDGLSDEDQIEAEEAEAEAQPLIEPDAEEEPEATEEPVEE